MIAYFESGVPGGHECPHCDELNTCYIVACAYTDSEVGRTHEQKLACSTCGQTHSVTWVTQSLNYPATSQLLGE